MVALGNMVVKKFGREVGGREGYLNPEGKGTAAGRIWRETGERGGLSIFPGKPCMGQRQPLTFNQHACRTTVRKGGATRREWAQF